jgi:hypothetical protein
MDSEQRDNPPHRDRNRTEIRLCRETRWGLLVAYEITLCRETDGALLREPTLQRTHFFALLSVSKIEA